MRELSVEFKQKVNCYWERGPGVWEPGICCEEAVFLEW